MSEWNPRTVTVSELRLDVGRVWLLLLLLWLTVSCSREATQRLLLLLSVATICKERNSGQATVRKEG